MARPGRRRHAPDRRRPVLAVLGDRRPHARVGRVGPPARRAAAHPPGRDGGRGGVLPGHVRPATGRLRRIPRAGWARTSGWPTASTCPRATSRKFARTGTGTAHCPTSNGRLGSGIAPVRGLLDAGAPVGLGIDGAASNEAGTMAEEMHQAMLFARLRNGPTALTARDCLRLGTMGGARVPGSRPGPGLARGRQAGRSRPVAGGRAGRRRHRRSRVRAGVRQPHPAGDAGRQRRRRGRGRAAASPPTRDARRGGAGRQPPRRRRRRRGRTDDADHGTAPGLADVQHRRPAPRCGPGCSA